VSSFSLSCLFSKLIPILKLMFALCEMFDAVCDEGIKALQEEAFREFLPRHPTDGELQKMFNTYQSVLCSDNAARYSLFHSEQGLFTSQILLRLVNRLLHSPIGGFNFSACQLMRTLAPLWRRTGNSRTPERPLQDCLVAEEHFHAGYPLLAILQTEVSSHPAFVESLMPIYK
jgi:hypothetical protein